MLHTLLADDSGVMLRADEQDFEEFQEAVRVNESIYGAKLNIRKSTVIPIGLSDISDCLTRTGGHIARKREIVRYLGYPMGWHITEEDQKEVVISKLPKKLGNWKFKLLTFSGRLLALKHIIRSTPVHLIACLNLQRQTLNAMEIVSRIFLWGSNQESKPKVPLVAWKEVQRAKKSRGLALEKFETASRAMRMRLASKLITQTDEDWVGAAKQVIKSVKPRGRAARVLEQWSLQEVLILKPPCRVPTAPTITGLLEVWRAMKVKLKLARDTKLDPEMEIHKILVLAEQQEWIGKESHITCARTLARAGCKTLAEWKVWINRSNAFRSTEAGILGSSLSGKDGTQCNLQDLPWYWKPSTLEYLGWKQPSRVWKALIRDTTNGAAALNHKWNIQDSGRKWEKRLQKIWSSPLQNRDKVCAWRLLQHGIPTMDRMIGDFIDMIEEAWKHRNCAKAIKTSWLIWLDRNSITYNDRAKKIPMKVVTSQTWHVLTTLTSIYREDSKRRQEFKPR
ncbi:hypothetical protein R1sor_000486 [Riccia sorocarpa]|uniref:Reverse transcriptase domain-containing protein n=1 Tax=Riccia sorocarpa TaxID=122646 RepID=A0ABD3GX81_9MARC